MKTMAIGAHLDDIEIACGFREGRRIILEGNEAVYQFNHEKAE